MRLTQEEWQIRREEVLLASKTCRTVDEIIETTQIEKNQIQTLYKKFPEEAEMIKNNLRENKKKIKTKRTTKKKTNSCEKETSIIMLDTCVKEIWNFVSLLEGFVERGNRLGISDLVLEELNRQQNYGTSATKLLHVIKDNIEQFEYYAIKETKRETVTVDQTIIEACKENPNIKLLTADKEMYIRATLQGVKTIYVSKNLSRINESKFSFGKKKHKKQNSVDISNVFLDDGQVVYVKENNENQYSKVFSKKGEEKHGILVYLEEGDHIFSCFKKDIYLMFSDVEFDKQGFNEGIKRYQTKIYDTKNLTMISLTEYKSFIKQADRILS